MSGNWEWLARRELSLGTVIAIFECTATVEHGDDRFRILVHELLHEDYKFQDRNRAQNEQKTSDHHETLVYSHPIAREIEAAQAHLISSQPYLARAFEAARESSHASAGQLDSLWRQVDGLIEALRALAVFVEHDGHVAPGDEQMEMPL